MVRRMSEEVAEDTSLQDQLADIASALERDDARARAANVHEHVLQQLLSKKWVELEVIECEDYLLFPESLYRRNAKGGFTEEKVMVRVPREPDIRKARVKARKWALEDGLDLDRDADLVDQLETICVMSDCIRNFKPSIDPRNGAEFREAWEPDPTSLEKRYDKQSLNQLWAKIDALGQVVDPRPNTLGKEETLGCIAAIARSRTIAPLHVYGSGAQQSCIVFMAQALLSFLASK